MPENPGVGQTVTSKIMSSPFTRGSRSSDSNCIWSRVIGTFALAVLASAFVACGMGYSGKGSLQSNLGRPDITGRALLVGDRPETPGYGLYSYVLFESEPTDETKPLYLAVILACLEEVQDLGELEKRYKDSLQKLNGMFIPVIEDVTDSQGNPTKQPEHKPTETRAEEILQRYNYSRAKAILKQLSPIQRHGGPYLVSSLAPASGSGSPTVSLFQDLSVVHFVSSEKNTNKMAREWVLDFIGRVSTLRSTDWNPELLKGFAGEMQDAQQPSFVHYKVRTDQSDVKKWIVAIVFPIPDSRTDKALLVLPSRARIHEVRSVPVYPLEGQSRSAPRRVSFPSHPSPVRQKEQACDARCRAHR